jgi:hypothetical protein
MSAGEPQNIDDFARLGPRLQRRLLVNEVSIQHHRIINSSELVQLYQENDRLKSQKKAYEHELLRRLARLSMAELLAHARLERKYKRVAISRLISIDHVVDVITHKPCVTGEEEYDWAQMLQNLEEWYAWSPYLEDVDLKDNRPFLRHAVASRAKYENERALAFAGGAHERLGTDSWLRHIDTNLLPSICTQLMRVPWSEESDLYPYLSSFFSDDNDND